eukprot:jgi/Ulvmu1/324/UM001_0328.1
MLTLLLLAGWVSAACAVAPGLQCDRGNSRDAASVISSVIQPKVAALGYQLPHDCPLDLSRGLYSKQEAHKVLMRKNVWRCSWDQKTFRGEAYIDIHMDTYHSHEVPEGSPVCLADLCGPLHCDFFKSSSRGALNHLSTVPCHQGVMDEFRRNCQDVAYQCFAPIHGQAAEELHAFMLSTFCAAATCSWHSRRDILQPLVQLHSGSQYLRVLGLVALAIVLIIVYTVIAAQWLQRSGSTRGAITKALESAGIVKKQTRKLI